MSVPTILMNSNVMVAEGNWSNKRITAEEYVRLFNENRKNGFESYIGYPQLAIILTNLLGVVVPVSKKQTIVKGGELILVSKLGYRLENFQKANGEHGQSLADYEFYVMSYTPFEK